MLFDEDVPVTLAAADWPVVNRAIVGDGGAQNLLRELLATSSKPRRLTLTYVQLDRAYHYATAYGNGGFQDRFKLICDAAQTTGKWSPRGPLTRKRSARGGAFGRAK